MDWVILILGVPAVLIPLVLLFGFAGCYPVASVCFDDTDCPLGTQWVPINQCVAAALVLGAGGWRFAGEGIRIVSRVRRQRRRTDFPVCQGQRVFQPSAPPEASRL